LYIVQHTLFEQTAIEILKSISQKITIVGCNEDRKNVKFIEKYMEMIQTIEISSNILPRFV